MTKPMTKYLALLLAGSGIALPGCIPVAGNRILGSDLALADARFSRLPASMTIGFSPDPGARRIYTSLELQRIARVNGIQAPNPEALCFELPMIHVGEDLAAAAMRRSIPAEADLKIRELANFDVPAGLLEFPIEGLEPPTLANHGVQLWRGRVKYAETRQVAFWARVEVSVRFQAVVAAVDLPQNAAISASSLRIETHTGTLEREQPATRIEDVQGRMPRRALKAGSVIPIAILVEAPAVRKGDPVAVEIQSGTARIRFEAIAESDARDGDMVALRNPINGKSFKAKLDPGAKAFLVIAAGQTL